MVSMFLVLLGVGLFLGNGVGFKKKTALQTFKEVKYHQSYTPGICYQL